MTDNNSTLEQVEKKLLEEITDCEKKQNDKIDKNVKLLKEGKLTSDGLMTEMAKNLGFLSKNIYIFSKIIAEQKLHQHRETKDFFKQHLSEFIRKLRKEFFTCGCGNEYLAEDKKGNEWELMCGKHIWKDKDTISELHLCEDCLDRLEAFDKLAKEEFGGLVE